MNGTRCWERKRERVTMTFPLWCPKTVSHTFFVARLIYKNCWLKTSCSNVLRRCWRVSSNISQLLVISLCVRLVGWQPTVRCPLFSGSPCYARTHIRKFIRDFLKLRWVFNMMKCLAQSDTSLGDNQFTLCGRGHKKKWRWECDAPHGGCELWSASNSDDVLKAYFNDDATCLLVMALWIYIQPEWSGAHSQYELTQVQRMTHVQCDRRQRRWWCCCCCWEIFDGSMPGDNFVITELGVSMMSAALHYAIRCEYILIVCSVAAEYA